MAHHTLKSPALIGLVALAAIGSACSSGTMGSGCSPSALSNDGALPAAPSGPTDDKDKPGASQDDGPPKGSAPSTSPEVGARTDEKQGEVEDQDSAKAVDIAPPKAGPPPPRPQANNTGPSRPAALIPSGSLTITTDGTVLENLDITGAVAIDADNVTIRNFRINTTSPYGINVANGHRGILLEDGEIYGMTSAGILGVGFTARRLHIHDGGGDGLKVQGTGGPTLVEACFIEKLGTAEGAHADGNQTRGGSNITFRYNNIYMPNPGTPSYPGEPYKSNATFFLQLGVSNFVIEHNWLTGGNYTIYCITDNQGVFVRNNIFGRGNGGLSEGKEDRRIRTGDCEQWSGNRWEDTGGPI
jgi:hypothetical protein